MMSEKVKVQAVVLFLIVTSHKHHYQEVVVPCNNSQSDKLEKMLNYIAAYLLTKVRKS